MPKCPMDAIQVFMLCQRVALFKRCPNGIHMSLVHAFMYMYMYFNDMFKEISALESFFVILSDFCIVNKVYYVIL